MNIPKDELSEYGREDSVWCAGCGGEPLPGDRFCEDCLSRMRELFVNINIQIFKQMNEKKNGEKDEV